MGKIDTLRPFLAATIALALVSAAAAAPARKEVIAGKVGKTNVEVGVILHPQADRCSAAQKTELRRQARALGEAHVRDNLPKLVRQAGTDASGAKEFFGVTFIGACLKDGTAWLAFPVEGKDKSVSRYAPGVGWTAWIKL